MKSPVIIIGIGEMGGVFARGLLRAGHAVYPADRTTDLAELAQRLPAPELVLVAVAEKDLHSVLKTIPPGWHARIALLQNELLPADWQPYAFVQPTVISVWFEKKKGKDVKVLIPSPVYGPAAGLLQESLGKIDIPVRVLGNTGELQLELVIKNTYIVTTNCAGLVTGGTVSELWAKHRDFAKAIAHEVIQIQASLVGVKLPADKLIKGMLKAFNSDPDHGCMGRSAPARLTRALQQADASGLGIPELRKIAANR